MDAEKLTLKFDKRVAAVPCLELVAFSFGVPADGTGFARFLRVFCEAFGDRLAVYRTGDMKRFRPFDAQALKGPRHWFSDPALLATKLLGFEAHAGATARDIAAPALDISLMGNFEPQRYVFRMVLPVESGDSPDSEPWGWGPTESPAPSAASAGSAACGASRGRAPRR